MANSVEKSCTMLVYNDKQVSVNEIKEALEGSDVEAKIDAMQKAVTMLLNGEQLPQLFITIVRYVLPSEDHTVQKLLLLYLVGLWLVLLASRVQSSCAQDCNPHQATARACAAASLPVEHVAKVTVARIIDDIKCARPAAATGVLSITVGTCKSQCADCG